MSFKELTDVKTPAPTNTWQPIPHDWLVRGVREALTTGGLKVTKEEFGLNSGGNHFFGLLYLGREKSSEGDYELVAGVRNSHDQRFPAGLAVGDHVFACDNLSFSGEVTLARKHTKFIFQDLPRIIADAVGRLGDLRIQSDKRIATYKAHDLQDNVVNNIIINALDAKVIPSSHIEKVLNEYRTPSIEEFKTLPNNAWRLHNAFTTTMRDRVATDILSQRTIRLNGILDTVCGIGIAS